MESRFCKNFWLPIYFLFSTLGRWLVRHDRILLTTETKYKNKHKTYNYTKSTIIYRLILLQTPYRRRHHGKGHRIKRHPGLGILHHKNRLILHERPIHHIILLQSPGQWIQSLIIGHKKSFGGFGRLRFLGFGFLLQINDLDFTFLEGLLSCRGRTLRRHDQRQRSILDWHLVGVALFLWGRAFRCTAEQHTLHTLLLFNSRRFLFFNAVMQLLVLKSNERRRFYRRLPVLVIHRKSKFRNTLCLIRHEKSRSVIRNNNCLCKHLSW
jgi:hypothetical protein